jgi:hypothetical protein
MIMKQKRNQECRQGSLCFKKVNPVLIYFFLNYIVKQIVDKGKQK